MERSLFEYTVNVHCFEKALVGELFATIRELACGCPWMNSGEFVAIFFSNLAGIDNDFHGCGELLSVLFLNRDLNISAISDRGFTRNQR